MWSAIQRLDAYPKLSEAVQVKTLAGGIVSLSSLAIIFMLFCSELLYYMQPVTRDHLVVDTIRSDKLKIMVDMQFPAVPCSLLSMEANDPTGSKYKDVSLKIMKRRVDKNGVDLGEQQEEAELGGALKEEDVLKAAEGAAAKCGDCYGAQDEEGQCCNTCEQVKAAYRKKGWALTSVDHIEQCKEVSARVKRALGTGEGCHVAGFLTVDKASGSFNIGPGEGFREHHNEENDLDAFEAGLFNVSHIVNTFSFGDEYPGIVNPLNGATKTVAEGGVIFQYYIKIVPTTYEYLNGSTIVTNQFSVTEHSAVVKERSGLGVPGVVFFFDISPIKVQFKEERRSFFHFMTQLCAIIGGVYTVSSLVDKLLYKSLRTLEKNQMGKFR